MRARAGMNWLPEETKALRERLESGMSIEEIANAHERTAGACMGRLVSMGLVVQDRNGFYYKLNPDAWSNYHEVKHLG